MGDAVSPRCCTFGNLLEEPYTAATTVCWRERPKRLLRPVPASDGVPGADDAVVLVVSRSRRVWYMWTMAPPMDAASTVFTVVFTADRATASVGMNMKRRRVIDPLIA